MPECEWLLSTRETCGEAAEYEAVDEYGVDSMMVCADHCAAVATVPTVEVQKLGDHDD